MGAVAEAGREGRSKPAPSGETVDVAELAAGVWAKRRWVMAVTAAFVAGGWIYGRLATPLYRAEAIIAPKESEAAGARSNLLSQLGGLGGLVGGQSGLMTNMHRLELTVKTRDLAERVVSENDLLPDLFPEMWDKAKGEWIGGVAPTVRAGAGMLTGRYLVVESDLMRKVMTVAAQTPDAALSARVVTSYLKSLNNKIHADARDDADSSRKYLEAQLATTVDPLLREKILNLISFEIEKAMLVASKGFDVLERPVTPEGAFKPRRRMILAVCFALGLVLSTFGVLVQITLRASRKPT